MGCVVVLTLLAVRLAVVSGPVPVEKAGAVATLSTAPAAAVR